MVSLYGFLAVVAIYALSVQASPKYPQHPQEHCAADHCFASAKWPATHTPAASKFCQSYIGHTRGTVTRTSTVTKYHAATSSKSTLTKTTTVTKSSTTTPAQATVTATVSVTSDTSRITSGSVCTVTSSTSFDTFISYPTRAAQVDKQKRNYPVKPSVPAYMSSGCDESRPMDARISSACSCFLTSKTITHYKTTTKTNYGYPARPTTVTSTSTTTKTVTANSQIPTTATTTLSFTSTVITEPCTSTSTKYITTGAFSCGISSPTAVETNGHISCTAASAPGATNARFRIEGNDSEGTIFEDCIASTPRDITTPSGGTHHCDGTNDGANPNPGATLTTQIDAAAMLDGFDYDGTFSSNFDDFFIQRIANSGQTSSQFWGVLDNLQFTPAGGCQSEVVSGDEGLWAFDAFNKARFLRASPDYAVVNAGDASVHVVITNENGDSQAGVDMAGQTTDGSGTVTIEVPTIPGCYQYKATAGNALRSNAFYLTVLLAKDV